LTRQLEGELELERGKKGGAAFYIRFPITPYRDIKP